MKQTTLAEIMTRRVVTVSPVTAAVKVADIMASRDVGSVVVLEGGRPSGIITERDFLRALGARADSPGSKKARDLMTSPVKTVPGTIGIGDAAAFMRDNRVRRLVVVDDQGRLAGIATETDIVRSMLAGLRATQDQAMDLEMLGMAAHDLKSPLTGVVLSAKILKDGSLGPLTEEQRKFVTMIENGAESMREIIRDILETAALDSGGLDIQREEFEVEPFLGPRMLPHAARAREKGVALEFTLPGPGVRVDADRGRLGEIVDNLVSNALKFTPAGGRVEARVEAAPDGLLIVVSDDGPGIPEDERDRVFQPFARTSNQPTGGEGSTGLGLSIVRRLAELHGGTVLLETEVGKGSTFTVTLPKKG